MTLEGSVENIVVIMNNIGNMYALVLRISPSSVLIIFF